MLEIAVVAEQSVPGPPGRTLNHREYLACIVHKCSPFAVHRSPFTVRRCSQGIGNTFGSGHK
jgi:hypothetical protein